MKNMAAALFLLCRGVYCYKTPRIHSYRDPAMKCHKHDSLLTA